MNQTLRVAALQLAAHDRSAFEHRRRSIIESVRAAADGPDLLVLPEGTLPAYVLGDDLGDDSTVKDAVEELRAIARERACAIVAGVATHRNGASYNSAIVIDRDGRIAGSADKLFLWHFDRKWFAPGTTLEPVETSVGRLGVMICADGRMPEIGRTLVDRGAQMLVMPTAWVTSGRNPDALENVQADLLARIRAMENGVPFVAANKWGVERRMVAYCGKSQIVDGRGNVVAIAPETADAAIAAIVELGTHEPHRVGMTPPPKVTPRADATRIAFSLDAPPDDAMERLAILDADVLLTPELAECVDARVAFDPAALVTYRAAGHRLVLLHARESDPWLERVARARALELRIFVIVFDRAADRAYAIDPDGTIFAGTFERYRIASASFDFARTAQTAVAPGTDVEEGLTRIRALASERR